MTGEPGHFGRLPPVIVGTQGGCMIVIVHVSVKTGGQIPVGEETFARQQILWVGAGEYGPRLPIGLVF